MPIAAAALKSAELVKDATLKVYPGAPARHRRPYQDEFNKDLLAFIAELTTLSATAGRATSELRV